MTLLTTSKLIAVFEQFAPSARLGLLSMMDSVESNSEANEALEKSRKSHGYKAVQKAMFEAAEEHASKFTGSVKSSAREIDGLKAGQLTLQQNTEYYLIKGFTGSLSQSDFHIRFENPGFGEITDFHLTTEEGWTGVNIDGKLWAKGRFFFKIKSGIIEPQLENHILGQGKVQASDMRLASLVLETMIIVYFLMYCLKTV